MKRIIYLITTVLLLSASTFAQTNNAIFFAENGERFQLVLNGVLQNTTPETNVKMTQLNADGYKVRIIFEDKKLGYIDYNLVFAEMGYEVTYNIKQNNKGSYVVRYISDVPIAQAPPSPPQQNVIIYHSTPAPAPVPAATTTTTIQQTRTTTSGGNGDNVSINVGMNVDGVNGGISINASGMDLEDETVHSTTTTTTTHTVISSSTTTAPPPPVAPAPVVYVPGYNGPIGCPIPMNPGDFNGMKETIRSKDFENTKLTIAKQVLNNNCLTSSQVKEIMMLFDFENTRLDYAKYAYGYTYDLGNYYKVNDAFQFESSISDLNAYINGRR